MKWKVRAARLWSIVTLESADQPLSASLTSCTAVTPHWIQRLSLSSPVAARFRPMQASCTSCWSLKKSRKTRGATCPPSVPSVRHVPRPVGFSPSPPVSVVLWTLESPPPTPRHSRPPQPWPVRWWRSLDRSRDAQEMTTQSQWKWGRHRSGAFVWYWGALLPLVTKLSFEYKFFYKAHSWSLSSLQSFWQNSCDKEECKDMQSYRGITFNILLN